VSPKVFGNKQNLLALSAMAALGLSTMANTAEAITANQIINAVEQGKILANSTRVNALMNGAEAYVSTYRNSRANDNDCKIEAVLVAKTVIDLAPTEISRVTVYFYSSANTNKRKVVSVTVGDVKAFGAGQLGKEQLLASLTIKDDDVPDAASRVSASLQNTESARSRKRIDAMMVGDTLEVTADLDAGMSDRDMKYEALKITEKAMESAGQAAKKVRISFSDPAAKGTLRQIEFDSSQLRSLDSSLQSALSNVQIASINEKVDVQGLSTAEGADKDLRDKALARLKDFDSKGVGVGPFLKSFFAIEQMIAIGSDEQAHAAILKLNTALDEQAERAKNAKEIKPIKNTTAVVDKGTPAPKGSRNNRFAGGSIIPDPDILTDPDRVLKTQETELGDPYSSKIESVYKRIIEVLTAANRTSEAQKFTDKLNSIRSRLTK